MIPTEQKLSKKIFKKEIEKKALRDAVGEALVEVGRTNDRIVVLTADLKESTRVSAFAENYPERFVEVGVAEQALATVASGMANYGKIPFITSFAIFSPGRNWEQIRTSIALNDVPVKIIGSHAGLSAGLDGGNHQCLEDMAMMRAMPNMIVVAPSDFTETKKAVMEAVKNRQPTYIRVLRDSVPAFTTEKSPFKIGRAEVVWHDKDPQVTIIACGAQVFESLLAAKELEKKGIECLVVNSHTIKPIDERTIIKSAKITGAVVTVEEHQVNGGLGGAVAEVLSKNFPVPMEIMGVKDSFGETGKYEELIKKHGLKKENIIEEVKEVLKRKNN